MRLFLLILAALVMLGLPMLFISGCTYDEAQSFGRAVDSAAYGYYGGRYQQAHPVVTQPAVY